jgi:hypothetical protein
MALKTITAANAKFTIAVPALGLLPFTLQGYSADAAFAVDPVDVAETFMGVDGKMTAGAIPFITPMSITLMADSESKAFFDAWLGGQKVVKELAYADATIDLASIGLSYICTKGALKRVSQVPIAQKVLQPVVYSIDWADVQPVPLVGLT